MPTRYLAGLFALGAIWGAAFMLIKIAVAEIPPAALVAVRLALAVAILLGVLYARGLRLPLGRRLWRDFVLMGVIGVVLPFMLISWGQQHIPSGVTAILNATIPLFSVLLAYVWTREERLGGLKLAGLIVGFAGVVLAVGSGGLSLASAGTQGQLAVLAAAGCYAVSGMYGRRAFQGMAPLVPASGQLLAGALVMVALLPLLGGLPATLPSAGALAALLALAVFPTAMAYILFYWIMDHIGATRTSTVTYLIAPFGLLFGALFLHERVGPGVIGGLALVILGILLANGVLRPNAEG
ncbi:MAG TPA: DMT family transporter [Roseiflexaceae bacterium]|nr:DMT family transporter [Roseiflexaceae bacterium]